MIDFSKFGLDAPLPPLPPVTTNASRASFEAYLSGDGTRTLRQMMLDPGSGGLDFVGTADSIAAEMQAVMQEVGGDGFLVHDPLTRKAITEVTDGLAPALQQRGLLQSDYPCKTFRENLLAF
jgi:alkanesulfonate monooxygenase SsuD/methylene tetrahydromethanopterin reductase-like flavin-dependent oxidoreductase (luciferase family)